MLTLYYRPGCPYYMKVQEVAEELGITFDLKSVYDDGVTEELIARGGKSQSPYLVDTDTGKEMYESEDIISYLRSKVETKE